MRALTDAEIEASKREIFAERERGDYDGDTLGKVTIEVYDDRSKALGRSYFRLANEQGGKVEFKYAAGVA